MALTSSVALCAYNGEAFLFQQLESISRQTVLPDELIVCDDGSVDSTLDILNRFKATAPFDVQIIQNPTKLGVNQNFSQAILRCTKDIVFICDQDDVWDPDRIEKTLFRFEEDDSRMVVCAPSRYIDGNNVPVFDEKMRETQKIREQYCNKLAHGYLTANNMQPDGGCSMTLCQTFVHQIFPMPDKIGYDTWISCIVPFLGVNYYVFNEPLFSHRFHESNYSWSVKNQLFDPKIALARAKRENAKFYRRSVKNYLNCVNVYERALQLSENFPERFTDLTQRAQRKQELLDYINYHKFRQENRQHFFRCLKRSLTGENRSLYNQRPQPAASFLYDLFWGGIRLPLSFLRYRRG